jgi:hypothetical protein
MGPAIALILMDNNQHTKKNSREIESLDRERNDRHRRWFRTMSEINRQRIPNFGRSIPPPPPISRVEPPNRRYNNKDFKFFQR